MDLRSYQVCLMIVKIWSKIKELMYMYAIFHYGGKQYKASKNNVIFLEKLPLKINSTLVLNHVLMIVDDNNVIIGAPYIKTGKIIASVLSHGRGNKIVIIKFRRRKHHKKMQGHRQWFTSIKINEICK
ncbi:MAG: 50S ribosomal subunit protein L21 [Candidatus Westeberhardia cardiocondylae]|nr:50S ribosomal subunit protein L21 [Candidatus Westeberhardia cardiocondylae]